MVLAQLHLTTPHVHHVVITGITTYCRKLFLPAYCGLNSISSWKSSQRIQKLGWGGREHFLRENWPKRKEIFEHLFAICNNNMSPEDQEGDIKIIMMRWHQGKRVNICTNCGSGVAVSSYLLLNSLFFNHWTGSLRWSCFHTPFRTSAQKISGSPSELPTPLPDIGRNSSMCQVAESTCHSENKMRNTCVVEIPSDQLH